jgi:uncharacterized protein (DUF427 family)
MKATWKGQVLAESDDTVVVEGNHYFPAASLRRERFRESATHTVCPWKGTASYYDVVVGDAVNRDAAWYYPTPKPAAANITGRVAFWKGVEVAALVLFVLLGACPALAFENLTGTWQGKVSCQSIDAGVRTSTSSAVTADVNDAGDGTLLLSVDPAGDMMGGIVIDDAHPDRAVVQAGSCGLDGMLLSGALLHAEVRAKAGAVKATLTATLIQVHLADERTAQCELKLTRTSLKASTLSCTF